MSPSRWKEQQDREQEQQEQDQDNENMAGKLYFMPPGHTGLQDTESSRGRRHDTDCDINDCQRIQVDYYLMPIIISTIHRPRTREMARPVQFSSVQFSPIHTHSLDVLENAGHAFQRNTHGRERRGEEETFSP